MEKEDKTKENLEEKSCFCPYCDNTAAMAYPFCRSCGKDFTFCPHCNQPIRNEITTCPHCGEKVEVS